MLSSLFVDIYTYLIQSHLFGSIQVLKRFDLESKNMNNILVPSNPYKKIVGEDKKENTNILASLRGSLIDNLTYLSYRFLL